MSIIARIARRVRLVLLERRIRQAQRDVSDPHQRMQGRPGDRLTQLLVERDALKGKTPAQWPTDRGEAPEAPRENGER